MHDYFYFILKTPFFAQSYMSFYRTATPHFLFHFLQKNSVIYNKVSLSVFYVPQGQGVMMQYYTNITSASASLTLAAWTC